MSKTKTESLQEFMARGGKITKVDYHDPIVNKQKTNPAPNGPAIILSLAEADLFYGEARAKKKVTKPKSSLKIDVNMLPESLRVKFLAKALEEAKDTQGDEDDE